MSQVKTLSARERIEGLLDAGIQNNMEAGTDGIPVGLKDFQDFIGNPVQCKILFSGRIISSINFPLLITVTMKQCRC